MGRKSLKPFHGSCRRARVEHAFRRAGKTSGLRAGFSPCGNASKGHLNSATALAQWLIAGKAGVRNPSSVGTAEMEPGSGAFAVSPGANPGLKREIEGSRVAATANLPCPRRSCLPASRGRRRWRKRSNHEGTFSRDNIAMKLGSTISRWPAARIERRRLLATGNWPLKIDTNSLWIKYLHISPWGSIICGEFFPKSLIPGIAQRGGSYQEGTGNRRTRLSPIGALRLRDIVRCRVRYACAQDDSVPALQLLFHKKAGIWYPAVDQRPFLTSVTRYQRR